MPLEDTNIYQVARDLRAENKELREVIRKQGQFIQDMKRSIREFLNHPPVRV